MGCADSRDKRSVRDGLGTLYRTARYMNKHSQGPVDRSAVAIGSLFFKKLRRAARRPSHEPGVQVFN